MVSVAEVFVWNTLVGAIRWDDSLRLGYFQYDLDFIEQGWELSPIKLPLKNGNRVYSFPENRQGRNHNEDTFKGIPGLLADVLPDRYGNQLINLWLAKNGRRIGSMNPVETLCFIGKRGMGALEFEPSTIRISNKNDALEVDGLVAVATQMLHQKEQFLAHLTTDKEKAMTQILKIGTSAGGARPKALIAYHPDSGQVKSGQGHIEQGFEHWLLKLDGVSDSQFGESTGWGRVEYAYYLMARACDINIMPSQLLEENGRAHFMTQRFDREGNCKHHIQTFCGLQHFDFNDMFSYSYEQLFMTMRILRLSYLEAEQMFRRMVFNVMANNYDDHTKNFSFRLKKGEHWELSPAYDLCFAYAPENFWVNQQTLSVNGKRKEINKKDFLKIAKENSIKVAIEIIDQIATVVSQWKIYAQQSGVNQPLTNRIQNRFEENLAYFIK